MLSNLKFRLWLGHYNKKLNSTKRPLERRYTGWQTFDNMMLKGTSNIMSPTFILNTTDVDLTSNYAVVEWANLKTNTQFLRYYFVADITIGTGNLCTLSLSEDYAGSWADEIKGIGDAYVLRTNASSESTEYFDRHLLDNLSTHNDQVWTHKTSLQYNVKYPIMYAGNYNEGCIVFTTAGNGSSDSSFGTTGTVYACNPVTFNRLMNNCNTKGAIPTSGVVSSVTLGDGLIGSLFPSSVSVDTASLAGAYFQPADYFLNCFWLPISVVASDAQGNYDKPTIGGIRADYLQVGGVQWAHGANKADGYVYRITTHSANWDFCICKPQDATDYGVLHDVTMQVDGVSKTLKATSVHSWTYNKWTDRSSAWSQYQIYLPALGMVELPAEYCGQTIRFNHRLDVMTGQVDIKMLLADETCIGWTRGDLGIPLQVASLSYSYDAFLNASSALANKTIADYGASYTLGSLATTAIQSIGNALASSTAGSASEFTNNSSVTTDSSSKTGYRTGNATDSFGVTVRSSGKTSENSGTGGRYVG